MTAATIAPEAPGEARPPARPGRFQWAHVLVLPALAMLTALLVGAVIIALSDIDKVRDGDVGGMLSTVVDSYVALAQGAFGSLRGLNETIVSATPLLLAGLAVSMAFKAGLFNIGATGQMLAGGMAATYVGFTLDGPLFLPAVLAVLAGIVGGAVWGAIVGVLKSRFGAHEVITTIMLNYIAASLTLWLLKTSVFQRPGDATPVSKEVGEAARLPRLFGFLGRSSLEIRAHLGFVLALCAAILFWWLINRARAGFEFRTFGANADAARYAGMHPGRLTIAAMAISGGFAGLAGASDILGGVTQNRATPSFAGDIGFDAIAVALLGRSSPLGTTLAALLFGALKAGGDKMRLETGVPVDLVLVLRALIVLFVAAPALTRMIWRVRAGGSADATQTFRGWGG